MKNLSKHRYDYFLIWGNGLEYRENIINIIAECNFLEILKITNYKTSNIKKFIRKVYSYDYAPFEHLRAKTRYLLKSSPEIVVIFVLNKNPDERWYGEGLFKHIECMKVKKLKEKLRNQFNPTVNGKRTEEHVVHSSDNEIQTENMLKIMGFKRGLDTFRTQKHSLLDLPYYLPKINKFTIKQVCMSKLYCNVLSGNHNEYLLQRKPVTSSPHYLSLKRNDMKLYSKYINCFMGGPLNSYYSVKKFKSLIRNLIYPNEKSYIIVEKMESDKFLILDGLHRASILMFRNKVEIPVILVEQ